MITISKIEKVAKKKNGNEKISVENAYVIQIICGINVARKSDNDNCDKQRTQRIITINNSKDVDEQLFLFFKSKCYRCIFMFSSACICVYGFYLFGILTAF